MLAIILVAALAHATAETYIVGDEEGWTFIHNSTFYDEWAADKYFVVGDKLIFNAGYLYTIYQVSPADAAKCDVSNPIAVFGGSGDPNITIELTESGKVSYTSDDPQFCEWGMELTITVFADGTSPSRSSNEKSPAPPGVRSSPSAALRGVRFSPAMIVVPLLAVRFFRAMTPSHLTHLTLILPGTSLNSDGLARQFIELGGCRWTY